METDLLERLKADVDLLLRTIGADVHLKRTGKVWVGRCPFHNDQDPSFTVYTDDPHYYCFGCQITGTIVDWTMWKHHCDFAEACERLNGGPRQSTDQEWHPMVPPPLTAPKPSKKQLQCDLLHEYFDRDERLLCYVKRFEAKDGRPKEFRPLTYGVFKGVTGWHERGANAPLPLFGQNLLALKPAAKVLLCEGEAKTDAANRMIAEEGLDYVAVSWMGGASRDHQADLSPLLGRDVSIWGDGGPAGAAPVARLVVRLPQATTIDTTGLSDGWDAANLEREGGLLADFLRDRLRAPPQPDKKQRFSLKSYADISMNVAVPYLVRDLIPAGGLTMIWGPPKCGKSFFVFDVAMHIATGTPYRGRQVQQGTVVYIALEGGRAFHNRVEAYRQHHNINQAPFYLITDRTDLVHDQNDLIAAIKAPAAGNPAVVVVDTLNRSLYGSENSDEDMAAYIKACDAIRAAFNCAVIVVHHCGIEGTRPRGHTSLIGAVDAQVAVKRDERGCIFATVEWIKDGNEGAVFASRLEVIELGVDESGEELTSCVIAAVETTTGTTAPKTRNWTKAARTAMRALERAVDEQGAMVSSGTIPSDRKAVSVPIWRKYAYDMGISTGAERAQQRAFERGAEWLIGSNLVGVWKEQAWII